MKKTRTREDLTLQQKRLESLYERELRIIVYQIIKKEMLPFLPISFCRSSKKFQSIRVFVPIEENQVNKELLDLFNKKYAAEITRGLILCKRFRRVPRIIFDFDFELNELNKLEEIVKTI